MKKVFVVFIFAFSLLFAQAPIIVSVSPNVGSLGNSYSVSILGAGFVATPTVDFGSGINVTSVTWLTTSLLAVNITVTFSATIGPHDVIVTNPSGLADTLFGGFTVYPETDPPRASLIFPESCGVFVSCEDTAIIVHLEDASGIDDSSIHVRVNGVDYDITSPSLILLGDSVLYFFPSGPTFFSHGDTVHYILLSVADTFGNRALRPIDCTFTVDRRPPVVIGGDPPIGGVCDDLVPVFRIAVFDSLAGVDSTAFVLTIIRHDTDTISFDMSHSSMRWSRDTLDWQAWLASIAFELEETILVCLHAEDKISDRFCGPNVLDTCWEILFRYTPPTDIDLTVDRVYTDQFPMVTAHCIVVNEDERTVEGLDESNFTVWEDHTGWQRQYPIIVHSLGGSGMVDIVFVVDSTGSMSGMISDVRSGIRAFADSLTYAGISPRLGLVTFGDGFNFPHGYDLTGSISTFRTWVSAVGASGGADWKEESLDAIKAAIDSMHFRPGAAIVIIMVTDAPACTLGDPPGSMCRSDVTPGMVISALLSRRAICFIVSRDMSSFRAVYTNIATSTGGQYFHWTGPGSFNPILSLIAEAIRGGYLVSWTSSHPYGDCQLRPVRIRVECYGLSDVDNNQYIAPCSPTAAIIEPKNDKWTSDSLQRIVMSFAELDSADSIEPNSIQFMVNDNLYSVFSSELSYSAPLLTWVPSTPFHNNQRVNVELTRVMDSQGNLPFRGPVRWHFFVDLKPPKVANRSPDSNEIVINHSPMICFDIWDDESGLNKDGLLLALDNRESRQNIPPFIATLDIMSPGVSLSGRRLCINTAEAGIQFWDRDTVCVDILQAVDSPDYGEPNKLSTRWCFIIPDDDTLCPRFSELVPDESMQLLPRVPFDIQAKIVDEEGSGVLCAWVEWDNDGDLDDGTVQRTDLSRLTDDIFKTVEQIPPQSEAGNFVYRVCACDADTDQGEYVDTSCCCSDIMPLYFGQGPLAEIIEPQPFTVTTNKDQRIVMRIYDDDVGVDPSTILLNVAGVDYHVDGTELVYSHDTLYFYPQPTHYFADGQNVQVKLVSADDYAHHPLRGVYSWQFFVDLTPPFIDATDPTDGQVVLESQYDINVSLQDRWREVDSLSIEFFVYNRSVDPTGSSGTTYHVTDAGLYWDQSSHTLRFVPEDVVPPFAYPNNDTVCIRITASDIEPDYGSPNVMDAYEFCFVYSITGCDCRPLIATPNGDGINDVVYFTYPDMIFGHGIIRIYDHEGELIWESHKGATTWDCRSSTGNIVRPGVYIYAIEVDGEIVCNGTITVVR